MTPQEALLRFFSSTPTELKPQSPILVACSGGPDSVALVHLLNELQNAIPHIFRIGHINHKLRGADSEKDAQFVKALAEQLGWPYEELVCPVADKPGNLEENARVQRYNALWKIAKMEGCSCILTAHTSDDQVETLLMNLFRGAGPDGLGGIHPLRKWPGSPIPLGRPLLEISKDDLVKFLKTHRLKFRKDQTNRDQKYFRNWIRQKLVPQIEKKVPHFKKRAAQTAGLIRDEQEIWAGILASVKQQVVRDSSSGVLLDLKKLLRYPAATQRRLIRELIGKDLVTFEGVEGLRRWMQSSPTNGRFWQLRKGWLVERLSKSKGSPSAQIFCFKQIQHRNRKTYLNTNSKRKVTSS